jgi:hypothetical protein
MLDRRDGYDYFVVESAAIPSAGAESPVVQKA